MFCVGIATWGSVPRMVQEPEVEEGEDCDFKDDIKMDPDIALSYIGDKVQNILGHFQKDFEGGVFAEKLGAKYGGYGSFLPTHQRSPSTRSHPKYPPRLQTPNLLESPKHHFPESFEHNSSIPVHMGPSPASNSASPPITRQSKTLKASEDASVRQKSSLSSDRVTETLPQKVDLCLRKPDNPSNPRTLKVRIRVGPDSIAQYNALGLVSPSTSNGESSEESGGFLIESHETPCESPANILRIMTSFPVSGSMPLSPLCEDLLYIVKKIKSSVKIENKAIPRSPEISDRFLKTDVFGGKKTETIVESKFFEKSENERNEKNSRSQTPGCTSFKAYLDRSEGERVNSSARIGTQTASSEQDKLGVSRVVNKLLIEKKSKGSQSNGNLIDGDCVTPINKHSGKKVLLSKKSMVDTSSEHNKNEKLAVVRSKNSNHEASKTKPAFACKLKERSGDKIHFDNLNSETFKVEPSVAAVYSNEGIVPAPVEIQEDWVACDRCQKWRLLPYGRTPDQLPDDWTCKMLDWLPGMNRCNVGEDETTKAIQSSYPPNTVPQYNLEAHADGIISGVNSADTRLFDQNHHNVSSDQVTDQPKIKAKQNMVSASNPVSSYVGNKKKLQRIAIKKGSSKELNQSIASENVQHPNKLAIAGAKSNKRKDEHVTGDDANSRKKIRKESFNVEVAEITATDALKSDSFQMAEQKQDVISKRNGKFQIPLKKQKHQMHDLSNNRALSKKACNGSEVTTLKRKLKDHEDNKLQLECIKVPMKESKNSDILWDKKSLVSQIDETKFNRCDGNNVPKTEVVESKIRLSGSKGVQINNQAFRTEQPVVKLRAKMPLTIEDIDKLRKDLGFEQMSTAAASSSSKVSDSRKNRISYVEVRGSPVDSVSSSPARIPYPNQVVVLTRSNVKNFSNTNKGSDTGIAKKGKMWSSGNPVLDFRETKPVLINCPLVGNEGNILEEHVPCPINTGKNNEGVNKEESDVMLPQKNPRKVTGENSVKKISSQMEPWNGKVRLDLRQVNKKNRVCVKEHIAGPVVSLKRTSMDSRPSDASVIDDSSKSHKNTVVACRENGIGNIISRDENKNVSNVTAPTALRKAEDVLREAEELRVHANLIKNSGFSSESNYEYFKAALKFLHGASLLEACNGEGSEHIEMNPGKMYCTAAKLCNTCGTEYEKDREMAAAALAYKCTEVAYLRVVYFKSSMAQRVFHDLNSSLQIVPQGESPSSSASDLDNLNNIATADISILSKGTVSHSGNNVIEPRNRPKFAQLLDFTRDVNCAMEAAKKSQDMFTAAKLEDSRYKEGIVSVKTVIDFSFEDVEEFIHLIWLALNTINRQGLSGFRD